MAAIKFLIGVDEAGRAPLAGPVAVGAAMVKSGFDWSQMPGVRDSKKLSLLAREKIFKQMQEMRRQEKMWFAVSYAPHSLIDQVGITKAVHHALERAVRSLRSQPHESAVYLDGLLKAPPEFKRQQTIIGGDDVLPLIALAAIAAKVSRDRLMVRMARKYPGYGLEQHKGYPTFFHRQAISKNGLSAIHRVSYCKSLQAIQDLRIKN
jgi:ribonuclease HII